MTTQSCEHIYCNLKLMKNSSYKIHYVWDNSKQEQYIENFQWRIQQQQKENGENI